MADTNEPNPKSDSSLSISPAPKDVTEAPEEQAGGANTAETKPAPGSSGGQKLAADALPDGTKPTVLAPGTSHRSVDKSAASIGNIYRKADILTTFWTAGAILLAGAVIVGVYYFFFRPKDTTPAPSKVTTLDKSELSKLDAFFNGNSAGSKSQVLTIGSSALFNNRVAMASDLKVVGGLQVSGTTALGDLTVDKTSTLGVTNVRGSLTVAGPLSLQSPAQFGAGATVKGNLATSGNGTFGGSLAAGVINTTTLTVSGVLNLAGHLAIAGQTPSASPGSEAGSGASANVEGNDTAGSININTGNVPTNIGAPGGLLVTLTFKTPYDRVPRVIISSVGQNGASVQPYVLKTANGFTIGTTQNVGSNRTYTFDYWVVQ